MRPFFIFDRDNLVIIHPFDLNHLNNLSEYLEVPP